MKGYPKTFQEKERRQNKLNKKVENIYHKKNGLLFDTKIFINESLCG